MRYALLIHREARDKTRYIKIQNWSILNDDWGRAPSYVPSIKTHNGHCSGPSSFSNILNAIVRALAAGSGYW
jgi:hypothetical protein